VRDEEGLHSLQQSELSQTSGGFHLKEGGRMGGREGG